MNVQFLNTSGKHCFDVYRSKYKKNKLSKLKAQTKVKKVKGKAKKKMKILIAYSSRTGNTRMIAEAIHAIMPEGTTLANIKETTPNPEEYDFIALGFWVDQGAPNATMYAYMEKIKNTKVGLFGTLGAWPDSDHAKNCMNKAIERLETNTVLGTFMCQGKIDPKILTAMGKMREKNPHPMTDERKARILEAAKHPNEQDCTKAQEIFKKIIEEIRQTK